MLVMAGKAEGSPKNEDHKSVSTVQKSSKSAGTSTDGALASSSALVPESLRYFLVARISFTCAFVMSVRERGRTESKKASAVKNTRGRNESSGKMGKMEIVQNIVV